MAMFTELLTQKCLEYCSKQLSFAFISQARSSNEFPSHIQRIHLFKLRSEPKWDQMMSSETGRYRDSKTEQDFKFSASANA